MTTFDSQNIQIHNADNFEFVAAGTIDLILTDPPFNIARETNFHTYPGNTINSFKFDGDKGWDSNTPDEFRSLLHRWSLEFFRVLKPGGNFAIFCADEYLSDLITALRKAGLKPRRTVTWRKPNAVPVNRKHLMMSACEYIVVGVKGGNATFNADLHTSENEQYTISEVVNISDKIVSVLEQEIRKTLESAPLRLSRDELKQAIASTLHKILDNAVDRAQKIYGNGDIVSLCVPNYVAFNSKSGNRLHPTEKPVPLLVYLLTLLSNEGDQILDPFSGSGSTGEASLLYRRKAMLIERDVEYYEKSLERIRRLASLHQLSLFE
jgi:DNA modification methylase